MQIVKVVTSHTRGTSELVSVSKVPGQVLHLAALADIDASELLSVMLLNSSADMLCTTEEVFEPLADTMLVIRNEETVTSYYKIADETQTAYFCESFVDVIESNQISYTEYDKLLSETGGQYEVYTLDGIAQCYTADCVLTAIAVSDIV